MKYYGKKNTVIVDYATKNYQPCWTCKNACGGCEWSRDFQPVPSWIAEKSVIVNDNECMESYKIIKCPKYICDRRYGSNK